MKKLFQKNKACPPCFARRCRRGFMMIEIIMAITIITLTMLATMAVAQKSIVVSRQAVHSTEATFLLEEGAEIVRILRDNNWTNISGLSLETNYYALFSGGAWSLSTTPNTVGIFTRQIVVSSVKRDNTTKDISTTGTIDAGTKLITVTVFWGEGSRTINKTLSFFIMDIFS